MKFGRVTAFLYGAFRARYPFSFFLEEEKEVARAMLDPVLRTGQRVLDAGCGDGHVTQGLLEKNMAFRFVCLDASKSMMERIPEHPDIDKRVGSLECSGLSDDTFDVILCLGVAEYLREPIVVLREFHRMARPDAILLITFSPPGFLNYLRWILGRRLTLLDENECRTLLNQSGWTIISQGRTMLQYQFMAKKS